MTMMMMTVVVMEWWWRGDDDDDDGYKVNGWIGRLLGKKKIYIFVLFSNLKFAFHSFEMDINDCPLRHHTYVKGPWAANYVKVGRMTTDLAQYRIK